MTGRDRTFALLRDEGPERLPCLPITMQFAADLAGIRYRDYALNARSLVEAQLRVAETFGFDYVSAISDPAREASDLGAAVVVHDNIPPAIDESHALLADKSRFADLSGRVEVCGPRMEDRIQAVSMLKERAGDTLLVEGWIEGPCAEAADLRGINTLMLDFSDDPAFVLDLFAFVTQMEIGFAKKQIDAGADIIGIGDAAASLVGPAIYREMVLRYEQEMVRAIHTMGALVRLHICGNTKRILTEMGQVGADIVDLDYYAPVGLARESMGPEQTLLGNIDPVRTLRDLEPDGVYDAFRACHAAAGSKYIVGPGCEVPRDTNHDNVRAMVQYASEHQP
ncbi:MAG: uroporphyrinogen decarboxylase family protein [Chthonomonadales bacterium]|nr:uroporphyrinogen decarboxylase family protein [Chthonomonadales bacterium]